MKQSIANKSKSISELVTKNLARLHDDNLKDNSILTGFTEFDRMFNGFRLGEFVVVGGRPAMGKTQLLINLAINISKTEPTLFFTLDSSAYFLTNRFISSASGISSNKILHQEFSEEEKNRLAQVEKQFEQHKLFLNDKCNISFADFKLHCEKQIQENGIKVIVIDYLQLMSSKNNPAERELEVSFISEQLKGIAEEFNICVIASSQVSRTLETRRGTKHPMLSDLHEYGTIEQNADKVIFIYRPEYYMIEKDEDGNDTTGIIEITLAKNRNGNLGSIKLIRDSHFTTYLEFEPTQFQLT